MQVSREAGDRRDLAVLTGLLSQAFLWQGRGAEGLPHARDALRLALEMREKMITSMALQWLALLMGAQGRPAQAVQLLSFAIAWKESFGFRQAPFQRAVQEPYINSMRAKLGEDAFNDAWARGQVMQPDEAVREALGPETRE